MTDWQYHLLSIIYRALIMIVHEIEDILKHYKKV